MIYASDYWIGFIHAMKQSVPQVREIYCRYNNKYKNITLAFTRINGKNKKIKNNNNKIKILEHIHIFFTNRSYIQKL